MTDAELIPAGSEGASERGAIIRAMKAAHDLIADVNTKAVASLE